jgi:hypothetical protein
MAAESGLRRDLARWYKPPQFWSGLPVHSVMHGGTLFTAVTSGTPTLPFQNYGVSYHLAKSRLNPLSAAIYYPMKQVPIGTSCKPAALVNKRQPNVNPPSRGTTGRY